MRNGKRKRERLLATSYSAHEPTWPRLRLYGRYGGPGWGGWQNGDPVDSLDEIFRRHDWEYGQPGADERLHRALQGDSLYGKAASFLYGIFTGTLGRERHPDQPL